MFWWYKESCGSALHTQKKLQYGLDCSWTQDSCVQAIKDKPLSAAATCLTVQYIIVSVKF